MMINAINSLPVKGVPLRVTRTVDRDEERREQEYERRNRGVRGEVRNVKNYLVLLESYLSELGIGIPPSSILEHPGDGSLFEDGRTRGELIESEYLLNRATHIKKNDNDDMTLTDANAGTLTLSQFGSARGYTEDFTSATSFAVNHALASSALIVQVLNTDNDEIFIPDKVKIDDANNITVTLSPACAVRISVISIH